MHKKCAKNIKTTDFAILYMDFAIFNKSGHACAIVHNCQVMIDDLTNDRKNQHVMRKVWDINEYDTGRRGTICKGRISGTD